MSTASFWHGRRVFVTGHTGFKGAWLTLWLSSLGARVTGYALPPPTMPSLYALAGTARLLAAETIADINDATQLAQSLQSAAPEVVFHLAAQPLVRDSYAMPVETFATNVMGTAHLLEAVRRAPSVRAVIVVTTDKCYENREWVWGYREADALGGHDPYSASKAAAEILTSAWRASFFNTGASIVTARAGNVIGGGDFARDRLLPDFVRAIEHGHDLEIRNPHAVRPWQFVLDPLQGYLELAERAYAGESGLDSAWNFGPDESSTRTVGEVIRQFADACAPWAPARIAFGAIQPQPHEATLLKLDTSKARAHLAWRPRLDLRETLEWTANWYRSYLVDADMHALTRMQLDQYMARRADC
ncbi:CDP-glucose 4,6-dehydratase [Burkholderia contaminans]|uniref:CDP-glucose 4,6-dehydratase n=1 Tax=Burkholderia contaminans TaxID=488447 RepID=UPI00145477A7|nr:CDP-glucose 4,6-dehydratase [Burkholderia contaminans]MCA8155710.1 CDP-glucose 4,6-dehydratase [Burkholderia contaminans]VWD23103.1 CDP-glucose 4,6-dehydratase [Burkholderia contaminans]